MPAMGTSTIKPGMAAAGRAVGVCESCGTGMAADGVTDAIGRCPECGERVRLRMVRGESLSDTAQAVDAASVSGPVMSGPAASAATAGDGDDTARTLPAQWVTVLRSYDDGGKASQAHLWHMGSALEAQRGKVRNLRAARVPYTRGGGKGRMWVEHREEGDSHAYPCTVRMVWVDVPATSAATFAPADVADGKRPRVGDVVRVGCDDTAGVRVVADVTASRVDRVGCGCWRLTCARPGGPLPDVSSSMDVLTGCGSHPCGILPAPGAALSTGRAAAVIGGGVPAAAHSVPVVESAEDGPDVPRLTTAETAKLVREAVKAAFPGVAFSVRSSRYSMGSSVCVSWTDGPARTAVEEVAGAYAGASFDGMTDSKSYRGPVRVTDVRGMSRTVRLGCDFVEASRRLSDEYLSRFEGLAAEIVGEPLDRSRWYVGDYGSRWGVWRGDQGSALLRWLAERVDVAELGAAAVAPDVEPAPAPAPVWEPDPEPVRVPVNPWVDLLAVLV